MSKTYLLELIKQIHEGTDLRMITSLYTADALEAIMQDQYDKQKYHLIIKPTDKDKL